MDTTPDPVTELRHAVELLARRTNRLESVLLRSAAGVVALLLVLGLSVPYLAEHDGTGHAVLGLLFDPPAAPSGAEDWVLYGAFALLAAAMLACVGGLFVVCGRRGGPRAGRVLTVLLVVAGLGVAGAWLLVMVSLGATDNRFRPAVLLLSAGVIGYGLLVRPARSWWRTA